MAHPEICPVCNGTGVYAPPNDGQTTNVPMAQTCHGCGGRGWVEVGDSFPPAARLKEIADGD